MSTTLNKLEYLDETKGQIKTALNQFGSQITDEDPFRSYVDKIDDIYTNWEKVTDEGTDVTLTPTLKGKLGIVEKGNSIQESTTGKNLLENDLTSSSSHGITYTINKDKSITLSGTADTTIILTIKNNMNLSGNGLFLSGGSSINSNCYLRAIYSDSTNTNVTSSTGASLENKTITSVTLRISSGTAITTPITIYPMLESGSSATTYEQYTGGIPAPNPSFPFPIKNVTGNNNVVVRNSDNTESQTLPLNLSTIKLNKIGEYQDYIYKNNGKWYKKEYIGKVTLNGTQNVSTTNFTDLYYMAISVLGISYITGGYNNYFKYINNDGISSNSGANNLLGNNQCAFRLGDTKDRFYIKTNVVSSNTELKTWFETHNTILYYVKSTATDIEITDTTLIEQLENIDKMQGYNGTTIITSTYEEGNAQMIINGSALKKGSD